MFEKRVSEDEVARILSLIAQPPSLRDQPKVGDVTSDFDKWFDGGAIRFVTGTTHYQFTDGARATVGVLPSLSVWIEFGNGARVSVRQE